MRRTRTPAACESHVSTVAQRPARTVSAFDKDGLNWLMTSMVMSVAAELSMDAIDTMVAATNPATSRVNPAHQLILELLTPAAFSLLDIRTASAWLAGTRPASPPGP
jgi:hypothetical protein